jgi:tetratricopeptide (TPR) repeat protein
MTAQTENQMQKWLDGQISLGAAANWDTSEIRIISEIAYTLAQQGRARDAVILFEGLVALAPATAYFQAALGALFLRLKNYAKAIEHLDAALNIEPNDIASLVNRGEAKLRAGDVSAGRADLEKAIQTGERNPARQTDINDETILSVKRARTLLKVYRV